MFKIKKAKINFSTVTIFIVIVTIVATITTASIVSEKQSDSIKINNSPTYLVFNRWFNKNEIPFNINDRVEEEITYHTTLEKVKPSGAKMVIKARNLIVTASAKGKILTSESRSKYSGFGTRYIITDLGDMGRKTELTLHLKPLTDDDSAIEDSIYITTQNELILGILRNSVAAVFLMLCEAVAVVVLLFLSLKRSRSFRAYFFSSLLSADLFIVTLTGSDLAFLIYESSTLLYLQKNLSIIFLPLFICLVLKEILKLRSVAFDVYKIISCAYAGIRLILFLTLCIPLDRYEGVVTVLIIILLLLSFLLSKEKVRKSQKSY